MAKLKYMGSADKKTIRASDDFGGLLPGGFGVDFQFNAGNNWVVDSDDLGLSQEAVDLLVEHEDVKDVSDLKTVPPNKHQATFLGLKSREPAAVALGEDEDDVPNPKGDSGKGQNPPSSSGGAGAGGSTSTAGGSTRGKGGRAGGSTRAS